MYQNRIWNRIYMGETGRLMGMEMSIILAVVFLLLCLCVIVYFMRREHQLLGRIQKMLDDAVEGKFKDDCLDESKMSMIENSMWRYICDNCTAYKKLSEEKEQLQELVSDRKSVV